MSWDATTPRAAALAAMQAALSAAGIEDPATDARWLTEDALGLTRLDFMRAPQAAIGAAGAKRLSAHLAARLRRVPVSQILGRREFYGRSFRVTRDVLDPRADSELLVSLAVAHGPRRVLDLGTGSGALLLSVLAECPAATGLGIDISPAALSVAQQNAVALGVSDRAELRLGDWVAGVSGRFDVILCNPPYIPAADIANLAPEVRDHEPLQALTPGVDGLRVYRHLAPRLAPLLAPQGRVVFEVGIGQAPDVAALLAAQGYATVIHQDLGGIARAVLGWVA